MLIKEIIEMMVENNLSIREASKITGIKRSTLHNRIKKYKNDCSIETKDKFEALMEYNQNTKHIKGGKVTKEKMKGKKRKWQVKKQDI